MPANMGYSFETCFEAITIQVKSLSRKHVNSREYYSCGFCYDCVPAAQFCRRGPGR